VATKLAALKKALGMDTPETPHGCRNLDKYVDRNNGDKIQDDATDSSGVENNKANGDSKRDNR